MSYDNTIPELVAGAIRDAQEMIRQEIAIARAEIRDEAARIKTGLMALVGAAVAGLLALVFLLSTIAWGLAAAFAWPAWAGFAIVTALVAVVAIVMAVIGRGRLSAGPHLPRTVDTLKENAEWLKARTQQ